MNVFPLVGMIGRKRSGKNSVAEALREEAGFELAAFADPLREAAYAINPYVGVGPLPDDLANPHPRRYADVIDALGYEKAKEVFPEVRLFLQRLGTEGVRSLDPDFWVRIASQRMDARTGPLVVTDVRFPNEAEAITSRGGLLVRTVRLGQQDDGDLHPSETALDDWEVDYQVTARDLEGLRYVVSSLLIPRIFPN